ncbi:MAG: peptidoglycan-binding protein [Chloroflexota bacterium]|nr:peptidoglycan-binding protein [Chloroflexota bacterium]
MMKNTAMIVVVILLLGLMAGCGSRQSDTHISPPVQTNSEIVDQVKQEKEGTRTPEQEVTRSYTSQLSTATTDISTSVSSTATPESEGLALADRNDSLAFNATNEASLEQLLVLKNSQIGSIKHVVWSPDGQRLAVAGELGLVMLDVRELEEQPLESLWLVEDLVSVDAMEFTMDGSQLLYTDGTGFAQMYAVDNGRLVRQFTHAGIASAISPDGMKIAIREEGWIGVRNLTTGEDLQRFRADLTTGDIWAFAFSGDGEKVIASAMDGDVLVWETATGKRTRTFDTGTEKWYECVQGEGQTGGWLVQVCHYPTQNYEVSNTDIWVWNTNNDSQQFLYTFNDVSDKGYSHFAVSQDERKLAAVASSQIEIWDTGAGLLLEKSWEVEDVDGLAFRPGDDGGTLASWNSRRVQFWDTSSGELIAEYAQPGSSAEVLQVAFSASSTSAGQTLPGRLLAAGRADGTVELWDTATGQKLLDLDEMQVSVSGLVFDKSGELLAVGSKDGTTRIWDMSGENPTLVQEFSAPITMASLAITPDGTSLAIGGHNATRSGAALEIRDVQSGTRIHSLPTELKNILALTFSPDGVQLAVGDETPGLQVWDFTGGDRLVDIQLNSRAGAEALEYSPDGRMLVVVTGKELHFFDPTDMSRIARLRGEEYIEKTAFNPDQCSLVVSSANYLDFLEVESLEYYLSLYDTNTNLINRTLAFTQDGYLLAFGDSNGVINVWGMPGALTEVGVTDIQCGMIPPPPTITPSSLPSATLLPSETPEVSETPGSSSHPYIRVLSLQSPPMQGDDVLDLQFRLSTLGYREVGIPDGVFGKLTDRAVRHFQEVNGLTVDGIVGPITWDVLFSSKAIPSDG